MVKIDFDPGENGFPFGNFWEFDEVERDQFRDVIEAHLNRLRQRGGAVFGGAARFVASRAVKPIRARLEEELAAQGYGLCGGMAYAALDFFRIGMPIPWLSGQGERPQSGSRLRGYLWRRQLQSFGRDIDRFLVWLVFLNWVPKWLNGGPSWLVKESKEEWDKLRTQIDGGSPIPLGLVRNSTSPFDCHQVLALGYDEADDDHGTIYLYDPNCPGKESTIFVGFGGQVLEAKESCAGAQELMGFFCDDYSPEDPRKFLGEDAPV
jgi:hypothetical protein